MLKTEKLNNIYLILIVVLIFSCNEKKHAKANKESLSFEAKEISDLENLLPSKLKENKYISLWREGSIELAEYISVIVFDKSQTTQKQIDCYYVIFDYPKSSGLRNTELFRCYEFSLINKGFNLELENPIKISNISDLFQGNDESVCSNIFFFKDFNSDKIYPISKNSNKKIVESIKSLFGQISRKERLQILALNQNCSENDSLKKVIYFGLDSLDFKYILNEQGKVISID